MTSGGIIQRSQMWETSVWWQSSDSSLTSTILRASFSQVLSTPSTRPVHSPSKHPAQQTEPGRLLDPPLLYGDWVSWMNGWQRSMCFLVTALTPRNSEIITFAWRSVAHRAFDTNDFMGGLITTSETGRRGILLLCSFTDEEGESQRCSVTWPRTMLVSNGVINQT
jgi:hypothetical protein